MKFTRRNFIKTSSLTAIGLVGLANSPAQVFGAKYAGGFDTDPLFSRTSDYFKNLIGSKFTIYGDDFAVSGTLEDVRDYEVKLSKSSVHRDNFGKSNAESFTLVFLLPADTVLPQNTYKMFHSEIGQFDLLLVPGENVKGEPTLAAVINRI